MHQDIENIKQQLEEVIKKNLPEKKGINDDSQTDNEVLYTDWLYDRGFNQALSQINTSLIADEVLKAIDGEISELTYYYKNKAVDEIEEDVAYIKVNDIIKLLHNLSPKENKNNENIKI